MASGSAADSSLLAAEHNASFNFSLRFESADDYKIGQSVRSPVVVVGACPVCLLIFPRGTETTAGLALSAFCEVSPQDDWCKDWTVRDVRYSIKAANKDPARTFTKKDFHSFTPKHNDRGWHDFLPCPGGLPELIRNGWVSQGKMNFSLAVSGASLGSLQRKRLRQVHAGQLWRDMKFTDMILCNGQDGAELPCHRAVLAANSEVLDRMLSSAMKEGIERRLELPDTSLSSLKCFLEFLYVRSVPEAALEDTALLEVMMKLADQYAVHDLADLCARSLVATIRPDNVAAVLRVLSTYARLPVVGDHLKQAKESLKASPELLDAVIAGL